MIYLDTSAFVKYYADEGFEKGASRVRQLIEDARNGNSILVSSALIVIESIAAFDRWMRVRAINESERNKLVGLLLSDVQDLLEAGALVLDPMTTLPLVTAVELVLSHHLSAGDALHLQCALSNPAVTEFWCADAHLARAAAAEGLSTVNPEL